MNGVRLTIGITTRNRPDALRRCLRSLAAVAHLSPEIIVFDDASSTPVASVWLEAIYRCQSVCIRDVRAPGYIAGRNRLMREAPTPAVLLMDDDAALVERCVNRSRDEAIGRTRRVAPSRSRKAEGTGEMGQSDAAEPKRRAVLRAIVHRLCALLRRDVFVAIGGYRESFEFYGEEKDYCLRLIEAGYRTSIFPTIS